MGLVKVKVNLDSLTGLKVEDCSDIRESYLFIGTELDDVIILKNKKDFKVILQNPRVNLTYDTKQYVLSGRLEETEFNSLSSENELIIECE